MAVDEPIGACSQCGNPLPGDAPRGLCPRCLLKNGLATDADTTPTYQGSAGGSRASFRGPGRFVPPTVAELAPLLPQMEILELLGQGGMGAVYKARQRGLDRLVAVKILPPDLGGIPGFADRFTREARALAKLNHPNIVSVFDFGRTAALGEASTTQSRRNDVFSGVYATLSQPLAEREGSENGLYFLVMEYIDGINLRQAMRTPSMTPAEALAIVPQVCEALQFAHDEGIVHRDIKPENILIDKRGKVKIADFGLAKLLAGGPEDITLTREGGTMGTPHYMAPEQVEGARDVDHRADIYSLGVVFYEMLTGELPLGRFAAPSKKVKIDVRLDEIVLRTLEKEPELRYQHASEVKTQVDGIRGLSPVAMQRAFGNEYKSRATLFGIPLLHIAFGIDPRTGRKRVARGIVAIGDIAVGLLSFGGLAMGGVTVGGLGVGLVSLSGMAIGLLAAIGGFAIGGFAWGGFAVGVIASGGFAVGYYAHGAAGFGVHVLASHVQDPEARAFFEPWANRWMGWLVLLAVGCPFLFMAVVTFAWVLLRSQGRAEASSPRRGHGGIGPVAAAGVAGDPADGANRSGLTCAVLAIISFLTGLLVPIILVAVEPRRSLGLPVSFFVVGHALAVVLGFLGHRHRLGRYTAGVALVIGLGVPTVFFFWTSGARYDSDPNIERAGVTYLEGHTSIAKGVAVSRDGKTLASVGMDGRLIVRDLPGGEVRFIARVDDVAPDRPGSPLFGVAMTPNGDILAGGNSESVSILTTPASENKPLPIAAPTRGPVRGIMSFDRGRKFAYVAGDSEVVFYDPAKGAAATRVPIYPNKALGNVRSVAGSPDGRFIAVTSSNMTGDGAGGARSIEPCMLTVYETTGEQRLSFQIDHYADFSFAQVVFADARTLVMCLPSGRMQQWKLGNDDEWALAASPRISPGRYTAIAASRDGRTIWLAHQDEIVGIDTRTGQGLAFAQLDPGKRAREFASFPIESIAPTGEPLTVAAALWSGRVAIVRCMSLEGDRPRPVLGGDNATPAIDQDIEPAPPADSQPGTAPKPLPTLDQLLGKWHAALALSNSATRDPALAAIAIEASHGSTTLDPDLTSQMCNEMTREMKNKALLNTTLAACATNLARRGHTGAATEIAKLITDGAQREGTLAAIAATPPR